jgi:dephospho-CoA kinase
VVGNATALRELEDIVHPLVAEERERFYEKANTDGDFLVVYDVPLLLENRESHDVDYIVVATADEETQKERVMARPGMTEEKFLSLLAKQMPDAEKRLLADYLVQTNFPGYAPAKAQVAQLVTSIIQGRPDDWVAWKKRRPASLIPSSNCEGWSYYHCVKHVFFLVVYPS